MIVALIDSGLGLVPTASRLRQMRPELDLVLMMDPDNAPWGPKPDRWVIDRVVGTAQHAVAARRGALVISAGGTGAPCSSHAQACGALSSSRPACYRSTN